MVYGWENCNLHFQIILQESCLVQINFMSREFEIFIENKIVKLNFEVLTNYWIII